jgi:hypothetical protein
MTLVVERWIMARLRHHWFASVHSVNEAIRPLLKNLNEQKLPGCRTSSFAELEAPALQSRPALPYVPARFRTVTLHIDNHFEIDQHRYSVPHALVGLKLDARITAGAVELLHRGCRVASRARNDRADADTTVVEHMPAAHRAHLEWTPQRLVHWSQQIGAATGALVTRLLQEQRHPEHGYRACLGLPSLSRRYGRERLEAACVLALELGVHHYRHVRDILIDNRGRASTATPSMMMQHTLAQLRTLKPEGFADGLEEQLTQPGAARLSFEERLSLLSTGLAGMTIGAVPDCSSRLASSIRRPLS